MNKKIDKYKHIIYECKSDDEVIKVQDIAFKNGYKWANSGKSYNGRTLKHIRILILNSNKSIQCVTNWSTRNVCDYFDNDNCFVVDTFNDFSRLFNIVDYNEKKILVYE